MYLDENFDFLNKEKIKKQIESLKIKEKTIESFLKIVKNRGNLEEQQKAFMKMDYQIDSIHQVTEELLFVDHIYKYILYRALFKYQSYQEYKKLSESFDEFCTFTTLDDYQNFVKKDLKLTHLFYKQCWQLFQVFLKK